MNLPLLSYAAGVEDGGSGSAPATAAIPKLTISAATASLIQSSVRLSSDTQAAVFASHFQHTPVNLVVTPVPVLAYDCAETEQPMSDQPFVERIASIVQTSANARQIFGEPVERGGTTVIPVARVQWGFGGGGLGHGASERGGGGGGARATGIGYIAG